VTKTEETASATKNEGSAKNQKAASIDVESARLRLKSGRWAQLIIGVVCMSMIANLQYSWTLFVTPIADKYHWAKPDIQEAFILFVLFETWLVPLEGWLVDRFGPRRVVLAGGVLCALGWGMSSTAGSLALLKVAYSIAGVGAGAVYGTCVGNALKWFPERRGLAAGITAAGFGAGSAATVIPLQMAISAYGYEATFLWFGIGQGAVILIAGLLLAAPDANAVAALPKPPAMLTNRPQFKWHQMIKTPVFWVMYLMFVLMAAPGLFFTANLKQIGEAFKIASIPVPFLLWAPAAVTFALFLDKITNGITRPFFGWVSDRLGRENAMFIAFGIEAISFVLFSQFGNIPGAFVALSCLVFFGFGEIYSLFPSTCADTYGWKYSAANAGALYTAKGTGALFTKAFLTLALATSFDTVFTIFAAMNCLAAVMALVVLKPLRHRMLSKVESEAEDSLAAVAKPLSEMAAQSK
jgi:OFA family oxalate/formate antiporter-like MFS transporter